MTKRIFALLGCLVLFTALFAVSVSAKSGSDLLVDQAKVLTTTENEEVSKLLNQVSDKVDFDVAVLTVASLDGNQSGEDYAEDFYEKNDYGRGKTHDGVMMLLVVDDSQCVLYSSGTCARSIDDSVLQEEYDASDCNYVALMRSYAIRVANRMGKQETTDNFMNLSGQSTSLLVDGANLLNTAEKSELLTLLNETSDKLNCDIVVVTTPSLGQRNAMTFADDFYDQNGYGRGENGEDGVLLLISMDERAWWVSTCGKCIEWVDAYAVGDRIGSDLSGGYYADAFKGYVAEVKREIVHETAFFSWQRLGAALFVGFIIALIAVTSMKAKLKTVRFQPAANNYLKPGSLNVTLAEEHFLYNTVTRTARPKDNDSGGGGSHTSSGGVSHGGGGGHF